MPQEVRCDLFYHIGSWSQAVSQQADHSRQQPPPSPRNLRPRPIPRPNTSANQRRHLAPTSGNPRLRKAPADEEWEGHSAADKKSGKRVRKMLDNTGHQGDPVKGDKDPVKKDIGSRPRGRPPGSRNKVQPVLAPAGTSVPSSPSKASSKSKSVSPKRVKSRANAKTDASIDLEYLQSCKPSVWLTKPAEVSEDGPIPPETRSLYLRLKNVPYGCIPAKLKSMYEQDGESLTNLSSFLPPNQDPYFADHLQSLKLAVDDVVRSTEFNFRLAAHERQWGLTTVAPLITELKRWPELRHCALLNVESCAIEPYEVRMERPDGRPVEIETIETRESTSDTPATTSRMVDLSIGLHLEKRDAKIVKRAFGNMLDNDQSLNQSLSYIKSTPLLVDIELKKTNSIYDAKVQLAVWKAGGLRKMQYHSWDLSMPMPGITVDGSEWNCYLFFVRDSELMMMGPLSMGSTQTVDGTFKIVYNLYILMEWGKTHYQIWFKKHILTWFQHKVDGTIPMEAGLTSFQL